MHFLKLTFFLLSRHLFHPLFFSFDGDGGQALETTTVSLAASAAPPLAMAEWAERAEAAGEEGGSHELALGRGWRWLCVAEDEERGRWKEEVAEEMAEAREMGMRQRPFPWRYCMAEPISSSIIFATWCSVTVKLSLLPPVAPTALPALLCPCSLLFSHHTVSFSVDHAYEITTFK